MAQAAAAVRKQEPGQTAAAPAEGGSRKKGRGRLYALAILVLACAGAVAGWLQFAPKADEAARPARETPPVFFPLEAFVVNLLPEFGDQYLQVELTLMAADQKAVDAIKARMPEVRNRLLLLLSSKRASELTTIPGKNALAAAIGAEINGLIAPQARADGDAAATAPVREVLFTSFIIQ